VQRVLSIQLHSLSRGKSAICTSSRSNDTFGHHALVKRAARRAQRSSKSVAVRTDSPFFIFTKALCASIGFSSLPQLRGTAFVRIATHRRKRAPGCSPQKGLPNRGGDHRPGPALGKRLAQGSVREERSAARTSDER